jgi:putative protease
VEENEAGSYFLNSQDLCLIKYLEQLQEAGVKSFKIEGRTKSVYYVATVIGAYRRALDILHDKSASAEQRDQEIRFLQKELEDKLVNRGYSTGFLLGEQGEQYSEAAARPSDWRFCGEVLTSIQISDQEYQVKIKVHNDIKLNEELEILRPAYDLIKVRADKIWNAETGEEMQEAHGGGSGHVVWICCKQSIPEYSVVRKN